MRESKIWAVDFDGTLCSNAYPEIGEPNLHLILFLKYLQSTYGDRIILWTCRTGDKLKEAVEWTEANGLLLDAVNENLPDIIEKFGGDNRKVFADIYLDDSSVTPARIMTMINETLESLE